MPLSPALAATVHGSVMEYVMDGAPTTLADLREDIEKIIQQHEQVGSMTTTPNGKRGACTMEVFDFDETLIAVVTIAKDGTVEALPVVPADILYGGRSVAEWDAYIGTAPNFATAQDRMEEAVTSGVDFKGLLALQMMRTRGSF